MATSRLGDEVAFEAQEVQVTEDSEELASEVAEVLLVSEVCTFVAVSVFWLLERKLSYVCVYVFVGIIPLLSKLLALSLPTKKCTCTYKEK